MVSSRVQTQSRDLPPEILDPNPKEIPGLAPLVPPLFIAAAPPKMLAVVIALRPRQIPPSLNLQILTPSLVTLQTLPAAPIAPLVIRTTIIVQIVRNHQHAVTPLRDELERECEDTEGIGSAG